MCLLHIVFCFIKNSIFGGIASLTSRNNFPLKILHIKTFLNLSSVIHSDIYRHIKNIFRDFPDSPVVKNLPSSAGVMGSMPG